MKSPAFTAFVFFAFKVRKNTLYDITKGNRTLFFHRFWRKEKKIHWAGVYSTVWHCLLASSFFSPSKHVKCTKTRHKHNQHQAKSKNYNHSLAYIAWNWVQGGKMMTLPWHNWNSENSANDNFYAFQPAKRGEWWRPFFFSFFFGFSSLAVSSPDPPWNFCLLKVHTQKKLRQELMSAFVAALFNGTPLPPHRATRRVYGGINLSRTRQGNS